MSLIFYIPNIFSHIRLYSVSAHLADSGRTPCREGTLPTGYIADGTPSRSDILPTFKVAWWPSGKFSNYY